MDGDMKVDRFISLLSLRTDFQWPGSEHFFSKDENIESEEASEPIDSTGSY